eukprot:TRINITY_DN6076_c0_g1_i4.p1 TRINITY_DN6076_c0_g1~~TRINITY_DN6076_c0_g1_i4.p1  ORF type:complete len:517 (-),score=59.99 TRINITY_DN6076_c0_g1_i4:932-2482(-)
MPKEARHKRRVERSAVVTGPLTDSQTAVVHGVSCLCFACVSRRRRGELRTSTSVQGTPRTASSGALHHTVSGFSSPDEDAEQSGLFPRWRGKALRVTGRTALSVPLTRSPSPLLAAEPRKPRSYQQTTDIEGGSSTEPPLLAEASTPSRGATATSDIEKREKRSSRVRPSQLVHGRTAQSVSLTRSPSPLPSYLYTGVQPSERSLSEEEPFYDPQDQSAEPPLLPPDDTEDLGAAAIADAWEVIKRRGDASLLQRGVPTAVESLWSPFAVAPVRARPTLEWFQRFRDRLPAMVNERQHLLPHLAFPPSRILRAVQPSDTPLPLGLSQSIGESRLTGSLPVPASSISMMGLIFRQQAQVASMARLLQQSLHSLLSTPTTLEQSDWDDLEVISFAQEALTRETVTLTAFGLANVHLVRRHAALQPLFLPARVQEACLGSAFSAQQLFGPEAVASVQQYRDSRPSPTRAPGGARFRNSSRTTSRQSAQPAAPVATGGYRSPRNSNRPYGRSSRGRGQFS